MKTIKYIILSTLVLSMICGGNMTSKAQENALFYETYRSTEIIALFESDFPFFSMIDRADIDPAGSKLGSCTDQNRENLMALLSDPPSGTRLPDDIHFAWGDRDPEGKFPLYALKKPAIYNGPGIDDIELVTIQENRQTNAWDLLITFNKQGTSKWAWMTHKNIGRDIAIVVDERVISAPRVQNEIKFGKCRISGNLDRKEAARIEQILKR